jgi:hypothetical protein
MDGPRESTRRAVHGGTSAMCGPNGDVPHPRKFRSSDGAVTTADWLTLADHVPSCARSLEHGSNQHVEHARWYGR